MTTDLPAIATGHGRVAEILDPETGEITPELVAWLRERYGALRGLLVRTARDLVDIGRILAEVRDALSHQEFLAFVAYVGISRSTAYRWIAAAEAAEGCSHVENVEPTALYALASRSTPDDVRERFLRRADTGHLVTHQEVRDALKREGEPSGSAPGSAPDPDTAEKLMDAILEAEDALADEAAAELEGRVAAVNGEVRRYHGEDRADIAVVVRAWGVACVAAAEPFLPKDSGR